MSAKKPKTLILNTIPHTGTHTMLYLFGFLGGIKLYWEHFEPNSIDNLVKMIGYARHGKEKLVFMQTCRDTKKTLASHVRRAAPGDVDPEYLPSCFETRACVERARYPCNYILSLEASNADKTALAKEIFCACKVVPPKEALDYMQSWEPMNASLEGGRQSHRGFGKGKWERFRPMLVQNRFKKFFENEQE